MADQGARCKASHHLQTEMRAFSHRLQHLWLVEAIDFALMKSFKAYLGSINHQKLACSPGRAFPFRLLPGSWVRMSSIRTQRAMMSTVSIVLVCTLFIVDSNMLWLASDRLSQRLVPQDTRAELVCDAGLNLATLHT